MKVAVDINNNYISDYNNILKYSKRWRDLKRKILIDNIISERDKNYSFELSLNRKKNPIYILYSSYELRKYIGIGSASIPSLTDSNCAYIKKVYFKLIGLKVVSLYFDIVFLDTHYGIITQRYLSNKKITIKQYKSNYDFKFIIID